MSNPKGTLTQEQIEAHATEKGITVEEAQAELEQEARTDLEERALAEGKTPEELLAEEEELSGIVGKYGGDPKKIAKAYKSSQQEITKMVERQKSSEQRLAELSAQPVIQKDPREEIKKKMQVKYPTLDDDVIDAIVEQQLETARVLRMEYLIDKANDHLEIEKEALKDDAVYKKYKDEIDKLIAGQPLQAKLSPGMAKRCRDMIAGQHLDDFIKEIKGESPSGEIFGQVRGPKTSVSTVIKSEKGSLTAAQSKQAGEMGLKPESFLAILKKHKDQAKQDGLLEPYLLTDPWKKRT